MKIRVTVTKEHIKQAKKLISQGSEVICNCPIALALQEKFNVGDSPHEVFGSSAYIYGKGSFSLSHAARNFVRNFDEKKKVQPTTFYLEKI